MKHHLFEKKHLTVLLALALLLSACAAPAVDGTVASGQSSLDPNDPVAVEIWHYYNGPQKLAFDEMVAEFNETVGQEKGIVVDALSQGNVNELFRKVHDAADKKVGADEVPAVFAAYSDTVFDLDQEGLVAALDSYLTEQELAEYIDGYMQEGRFDAQGNLKIFPTAKSTEILMLNKTDWDKFAADTGASLDALTTIEGITATSKAYYEWVDGLTPDKANDGKAMYGRDSMANYMVIGYYQTAGKPLFTHADGKVSFDPDKDALRRLWDNFYVPYINGWFGAYGKFRSDDAKTGDIIALVGSTSGSLYFPDTVTLSDTESYPIESLVFKAPCFADAKHSAVQQGAGMVVTKSDPRTELAAVTFLKWFTETDRNIRFAVDSGYMPVKKDGNDLERIRTAQQGEPLSAAQEATLVAAIEQIDNHEMYAERAFKGSAEARDVLEDSLFARAQADRNQVLAQIETGIAHDEAVAAFDTDEHFENWYRSFVADVQAAIG